MDVDTTCVLRSDTGPCIGLRSCHTLSLAGSQFTAVTLLLQGIMGEGDERFKTNSIKGLKPRDVLHVCSSVCGCSREPCVCVSVCIFAQLNSASALFWGLLWVFLLC